jgi:cytochrome c
MSMPLRSFGVVLAALALTSGCACLDGLAVTAAFAQETRAAQQIWTVPEIGALPNDAHGRLVRRGRDLITATYAYIGPEVADRSKRFAGNNLACGNCHLQAGTKKFGIPLFGLFGEFPHYSARSGAQMTIEDRFNSCMTRSMNGRALPATAPEMQAMVAYIKFLSTGVPPGELLPGLGTRARCRNSIARQIRHAGRQATLLPARRVIGPMALVFAAAYQPPIWATWCRRCGAGIASTTAPEWRA